MATENLTYAELAVRWGTSKDSARKRAKLRKLHTTVGNDGMARVRIDLDDPAMGDLRMGVGQPVPPKPAARMALNPALEAMERQIRDLRTELAARPSVAVLEALEGRIEDLRSDRDAWRAQAERLAAVPAPAQSFLARIFGRAA